MRAFNGLKVGVSGHQKRRGISWSWVSYNLKAELSKLCTIQEAFTSLAEGSDQVFAKAALELGIPVTAVIPLSDYERFFRGRGLIQYHHLLKLCNKINLSATPDAEKAFFDAGKYIVDGIHILFAVWDYKEAVGLGGTADIVAYAKGINRTIIHLDPIKRTISRI